MNAAKRAVAALCVKVAFIVVLLAAVIAACIAAKHLLFSFRSSERSALISKQLIKCQEISSVKYRYSDIVQKEMSSNLWLLIPAHRTERIFVNVTVVVRAGIADMTDIWFAVSDDGRDILAVLPPCTILSSGIEKQNVIFEVRNIKTNIDLSDMLDEINAKQVEIVGQTLQDGILTAAAERARTIVANLMEAAGFETVTVLCDGMDEETALSVATYRHEVEKGIGTRKRKNADVTEDVADADNKQLSTALYRLGRCLLHGNGTEANAQEGMRYLYDAAELGNGEAWREIGLSMRDEEDESSAVECFDKAVCYGSKAAYLNAALCHFYGRGCEKDAEAAYTLFLKAAEDGDAEAGGYVALYYLFGLGNIDADTDKAAGYLRSTVGSGDTLAKCLMALCYLAGGGTYKNMSNGKRYTAALALLRDAAEKGETAAYYPLALCYMDGLGVKSDKHKARRYLEKAMAATDGGECAILTLANEARATLGLFYANGWGGVDIDEGKAALLGYKKGMTIAHAEELLSLCKAKIME